MCFSKVLADCSSGHLFIFVVTAPPGIFHLSCDAYFASSLVLNTIASRHIRYKVDEHMGDDDV